MSGPRAAGSTLSPWHELVEHYTPDGLLGRLLLATVAGSVGGSALVLTVWAVAVAVPFWPMVALALAASGLVGVGLALVALWPAYLSLIGNVESASAYPESETSPSSASVADSDAASGFDAADPDDAVAVLKRRYADGELTEAEFERRLDDLLGVDAALDSRRAGSERGADLREPDRN